MLFSLHCVCGSSRLTTHEPRLRQVVEAAFKNETVGLVTREEFLHKRNTLQARQDSEVARQKRAAEAVVQQVSGSGS